VNDRWIDGHRILPGSIPLDRIDGLLAPPSDKPTAPPSSRPWIAQPSISQQLVPSFTQLVASVDPDGDVPAAPTGVSATGVITYAVVSWDGRDPALLRTYEVYSGSSSSFVPDTTNFTNRVAVTTSPVVVIDQPPQTTVYYKVVAVNVAGVRSEPSAAVQATTASVDLADQTLVTGTLAAERIAAGYLDVGVKLNAASIYAGTLRAITIDGVSIKGSDITAEDASAYYALRISSTGEIDFLERYDAQNLYEFGQIKGYMGQSSQYFVVIGSAYQEGPSTNPVIYGPYLARITNMRDPEYGGTVEIGTKPKPGNEAYANSAKITILPNATLPTIRMDVDSTPKFYVYKSGTARVEIGDTAKVVGSLEVTGGANVSGGISAGSLATTGSASVGSLAATGDVSCEDVTASGYAVASGFATTGKTAESGKLKADMAEVSSVVATTSVTAPLRFIGRTHVSTNTTVTVGSGSYTNVLDLSVGDIASGDAIVVGGMGRATGSSLNGVFRIGVYKYPYTGSDLLMAFTAGSAATGTSVTNTLSGMYIADAAYSAAKIYLQYYNAGTSMDVTFPGAATTPSNNLWFELVKSSHRG
jgi:hypothetical protein